MKTLEIKSRDNQVITVFLEKRIDSTIFSCKSSLKKRKADLLVHIDNILTSVADIPFDNPTYEFTNKQNVISQDEFDGLCQAAQIGENPFKCTIMCSNPTLNEIC